MTIAIDADVVSNGATVTFGSTELVPIADINADNTLAQIDVSGLTDDVDLFEVGSAAQGVELTVIGKASALTAGSKDSLTITYKSGATQTISQVVLAGQPVTITRNGRVETKLTFLPTRAGGGSVLPRLSPSRGSRATRAPRPQRGGRRVASAE
jgi:hypothetical protein